MKTSKAHEVSRASTLNTKLRLTNLALYELHATRGTPPPTKHRLTYGLSFAEITLVEQKSEVGAVLRLTVNLEALDAEIRTVLAVLDVAQTVSYRKEPTWTDEDAAALPDFIGIVGWLHAWPYVRAEVQAMSTKLGFPPLTLPTLLAGETANVPVRRIEPNMATSSQEKSSSRKMKESSKTRNSRLRRRATER